MDIQIIWFVVFLSILFIIYFISRLFIDPNPAYDPDWWDIKELSEKYLKLTEKDLKPTFCKYCGEKYGEGDNYCHLCGTGLKEPTT